MRTLEDIFQGENPEEFLLKCRLDLGLWARRVIQDYDDHTKGMPIANFHEEWLNLVNQNKRLTMVAPREHWKTSIFGIVYPTWLMFFHENLDLLFVSHSFDEGIKIMDGLKETIYDNELLQKLMPSQKYFSWHKRQINTSTRCMAEVKAYTEKVRGSHPNYLFCDEASKYRGDDIFYGAIMPCVNLKNGTLVLAGTPDSEVDLLAQLDESKGFTKKIYRAYIIDKVQPLWPEKFSVEKLEAIRKQSPLDFNREYMCDPVAAGSQSIKPEKILIALAKGKHLILDQITDPDDEHFLGCDFAMSEARKADYSVFTAVAYRDGHYLIKWIERRKGAPPPTQEQMIKNIYDVFKPRRVIMDESTFGKNFVYTMKSMGLPVLPYRFSGADDPRKDLIIHIIKMFSEERVTIPSSPKDPYTDRMAKLIARELAGIIAINTRTGKQTFSTLAAHDDMVISLGLAMATTMRTPMKDVPKALVMTEEDTQMKYSDLMTRGYGEESPDIEEEDIAHLSKAEQKLYKLLKK